jgi:protein-L-isoaspartate(D-aspartate) O-methyltransferase
MKDEGRYAHYRKRMVEEQLQGRGIHDKRVLGAMHSVERHLFVANEQRNLAYADGPLPIGLGQTISQPYIVALMTQLLQLQGTETILEIGTGSGYQAAVLALLARQVHTIERHEVLANQAQRLFGDLGIENIQVHVGDGSLGLPDQAPFDGILVTAAAPQIPQTLFEQLKDPGRLVIPVGGRYSQSLECWKRQGHDYVKESITPVAFVPLIGQHGWSE